MRDELEEYLRNIDESTLVADGLDAAIIGIDPESLRVIYSVPLCIEVLMEEGMSELEAIEYFDYNTRGAYVGEFTPIWSPL